MPHFSTLPIRVGREDTSEDVADLAFLAGPSPSKNEYRPALSTSSILPSRRERLFFHSRLLCHSLCIGGERGEQGKVGHQTQMGTVNKKGRR